MSYVPDAIYYDNEALYVLSKTDAAAKIVAIDACIDALLTSVLVAAGKGAVSEYFLNDGQTVMKTVYRSPEAVIRSVELLRKLRQQYINDINPRQVRLVSANNLILGKRSF